MILTHRDRKTLRTARHLRGWSQQELAHRLGVSRGRVAQVENGRVKPGPQIIGRMCAALKINNFTNGNGHGGVR